MIILWSSKCCEKHEHTDTNSKTFCASPLNMSGASLIGLFILGITRLLVKVEVVIPVIPTAMQTAEERVASQ